MNLMQAQGREKHEFEIFIFVLFYSILQQDKYIFSTLSILQIVHEILKDFACIKTNVSVRAGLLEFKPIFRNLV